MDRSQSLLHAREAEGSTDAAHQVAVFNFSRSIGTAAQARAGLAMDPRGAHGENHRVIHHVALLYDDLSRQDIADLHKGAAALQEVLGAGGEGIVP